MHHTQSEKDESCCEKLSELAGYVFVMQGGNSDRYVRFISGQTSISMVFVRVEEGKPSEK